MEALRSLTRTALHGIELGYRHAHHLQPLGRVLLLGRGRHRGPAIALDDGTCIERDCAIGVLHLNNLGFDGMHTTSAVSAARAFGREMLVSMQALADAARGDPRFTDVQAFHATSWLPPHGSRLGFVATPLPPGPGTRMRAAWFALLLWAFAPAQETRRLARPQPHAYWLSRRCLLERFPCRTST
ncbi:MAG: hypothetical protein IT532_14390 [Burkholderiales bacterium]|nr:hypothetical protein [Burkholderiales bacterium]